MSATDVVPRSWSASIACVLKAPSDNVSEPPATACPPSELWRSVFNHAIRQELETDDAAGRRVLRVDYPGLDAVTLYEHPATSPLTLDDRRSIERVAERVDARVIFIPSYACTSFVIGHLMHAFLHSPAFRATTLRSKLYEAPAVCALAVDWQYPYLATFKLSPTPDLDVPCLPPDYPMLPVSTLANRLLDLADDTTTGSVEPVAGGANFVSGVSTKDVTMVDSADSDAASPDLDASVIDLETGRQAPQSCDERCEAQSSDDSDSEPADATSSPDATPGTKQDTDIPTLSTSDDTQTPSADSVDAYKPFAAFDSPSAGPLDAILEDEPSSASTPSPDTSTEDSEVSGQFDDAPDDASLPAMDTSTSALAACPSASTINTSVGPATPATPQKFRIRSRLSVIAVQSPTSFQSPTVASRRRSLDAAVLYGGALAGKERTARDGFRARGFVRAIPRWRP